MSDKPPIEDSLNDAASNAVQIGVGFVVIGFAVMAVGVALLFVWSAIVG